MIHRRTVAVIGGSECSSREAALAEDLGRMLAQHELVLICGGGGGVMEAACRGAAAEGGITIGILPGEDPSTGNPYLSLAIPTGLGHARNALVVQAGGVVVAIGGNTGTLSEIALARAYGRPVIGLDTWSATRMDGSQLEILRADGVQRAMELLLEYLDHG